MSVKTSLNKAFRIINKTQLAKKLGVSYQAIDNWHEKNRMPDTEFSGRTNHAVKIEEITDGEVTVTDLLGHIPTVITLRNKK